MKIQDQFSFDLAIYGLNNIYFSIGDHSYFINSHCIQTYHKIVIEGEIYFIASITDQGSEPIVRLVTLIEAFFNLGYICLFVVDREDQQAYIYDLNIHCPDKKFDWMLVDWDNYDKINDYKAVKPYCKKCDDKNAVSVDIFGVDFFLN